MYNQQPRRKSGLLCYGDGMLEDRRTFAAPKDHGIEESEEIKIPTLAEYKKSFERELINDPLLLRERQGRGHPEHFLDNNTFLNFSTTLDVVTTVLKGAGCEVTERTTDSIRKLNSPEDKYLNISYKGIKFSLRFFNEVQKGRFTKIGDEVGYYDISSRMGRSLPSEPVSSTGMLLIPGGFTLAVTPDTFAERYGSAEHKKKFKITQSSKIDGVEGENVELEEGQLISVAEIFDLLVRSDYAQFYIQRLNESTEEIKYILTIMESLAEAKIPFFGYCKDGGGIKIREK